jgi:hypothetical protein
MGHSLDYGEEYRKDNKEEKRQKYQGSYDSYDYDVLSSLLSASFLQTCFMEWLTLLILI